MGKTNSFRIIVVTGNVGSNRSLVAEELAKSLGYEVLIIPRNVEAEIVAAKLENKSDFEPRQAVTHTVVGQVRKASIQSYPIIVSGPLRGRDGISLMRMAHEGKGELIEVRCQCKSVAIGFARFVDLCESQGIKLPNQSIGLYKTQFHEEQSLYAQEHGWPEIFVETSDTEKIDFQGLIQPLRSQDVAHV